MALSRIKQAVLSNTRILAYFGFLLISSVLSISEDYKLGKGSILNQWFVKIGWFWTTTLVVPLLLLPIKSDDKETVSQAIFRLILSSTIWYTSVNLFQYIDDVTGFDISGHTFLLTFSNLFMNSELKFLTPDNKIEKSLQGDNTSRCNRRESKHLQIIKFSIIILSILWDFMLIQTALFYHTFIQKAIAMLWAVGSWYILHIFFYEKKLGCARYHSKAAV